MLQIFEKGTHIDSLGNERTFTEEEVQQIAASYDRNRYQAPIFIGHRSDDTEPNQGLVKQ
jgi:hypothetical protein